MAIVSQTILQTMTTCHPPHQDLWAISHCMTPKVTTWSSQGHKTWTPVHTQIICPSSSNWSLPIHCIPKKSSTDWWVCGDYGLLNSCTIPDGYPVPHLQGFSSSLHGAYIFSKIDLVWAYQQIPWNLQIFWKQPTQHPLECLNFCVCLSVYTTWHKHSNVL